MTSTSKRKPKSKIPSASSGMLIQQGFDTMAQDKENAQNNALSGFVPMATPTAPAGAATSASDFDLAGGTGIDKSKYLSQGLDGNYSGGLVAAKSSSGGGGMTASSSAGGSATGYSAEIAGKPSGFRGMTGSGGGSSGRLGAAKWNNPDDFATNLPSIYGSPEQQTFQARQYMEGMAAKSRGSLIGMKDGGVVKESSGTLIRDGLQGMAQGGFVTRKGYRKGSRGLLGKRMPKNGVMS